MHFTRRGLDRREDRRECKTIHNGKKTLGYPHQLPSHPGSLEQRLAKRVRWEDRVLTNKEHTVYIVKDPFNPLPVEILL